jgi:enoyl-CoA hydratase/carnithine racemase
METYANLLCDQFGAVIRISINRPERLNALSYGPGSVIDDLNRALRDADSDDEIRCIVVTGEGRAFSSGGDTRSQAPEVPSLTRWEGGPRHTAWDNFVFHEEAMAPLELVRNLHKPVIAMINGMCYGAALMYAAHCDLRIASDGATFSLIEARMGASGADVFSFLIGVQWTKFLILTGEIISASKAKEIGLVLEVIPQDDLWPRTLDLATRIASMPRFGVMLNKANVEGAMDMMGWSANKRFSRSHKALVESMANFAESTDGRMLREILAEDGFAAFKTARDAGFAVPWLQDDDSK